MLLFMFLLIIGQLENTYCGQSRSDISKLLTELEELGLHRKPDLDAKVPDYARDRYIPYNFPEDCYGYPCSEYMRKKGESGYDHLTVKEQEKLAVQLFGEGLLFLAPILAYFLPPINPVENRDYFLDQITNSIARATIIVDMDKSEGSKNKTMALYSQSEASINQTIIIDQSETSTDFDQSESSNTTATETSKTPRFLNPEIERLGF